MRTIAQRINMTPGGLPLLIRVSQYDSDFSIVLTPYGVGFTLETGTTAVVRGTKYSGTGYSADATVDTSAGTVTITGDQQMTAVAGRNIYEIVLYKDSKELSSANFVLYCERAAMDEDTITDDTVLAEIRDFDEQIATAQAAATAAQNAQAAAEAAAEEAQEIVGITVDSAMSSTSTNPVQNKIVNAELSELKEDFEQLEATVAAISFDIVVDANGHATLERSDLTDVSEVSY